MNRKTVTRNTIAFDGEGIADRFVLLGSSDGAEISNRAKGLRPDDCIAFLTRPHLAKTLNVWFSFSYDLNMIFKHIRSADFWTGARPIVHRGWKITLRPGKMITFHRPGVTITHYDLFSFFACSFVDACTKWLGSVDQAIIDGKAQRKNFGKWSMPKIIKYNRAELRALVLLADRFIGLIESLEVAPPDGSKKRVVLASFHGPGAIAQRILNITETAREIENGIQPCEVDDLADRAYFGGRIELIRRGGFTRVWHGDIRSAYPAGAIDLPDLGRCVWRKVDRFEPGTIGVYVVSWQQPQTDMIGAFPYRQANRSVIYPVAGSGVYWSDEVKAAIDAGVDVKIHWGYVVTRFVSSSLSRAIVDLYDYRLELKQASDPAENAVKLALNSIYGKLAQRPTMGSGRTGSRSAILAGLITSRTRARMLSAAMQNQDGVIAFATDGLFCHDARSVPEGDYMGQWSTERIDRAEFVQTGFYRLRRGKAIEQHTRGYMSREIDFDRVLGDFRSVGSSVVKVDRFVNNLLSILEPVAYPVGARFVTIEKPIDPESDYKRRWGNRWGRSGYGLSWPRSVPDGLSYPYSAIPYRRVAGVEVIE